MAPRATSAPVKPKPAARTYRPVTLDLPEARIHGEWRTEPVAGRPVIVQLHDGLGCTKTARDLPDRLGAALGVGTFVYDRWGYGQSDRRDVFPFGFMEEEAERLPRILDAAGIDDCCLVGHSDGGTITLLHAAENTKRVRASVTMAAHIFVDRRTRAELEYAQRLHDTGQIPDFLERFHGARAAHVLWCWTSLGRDPRYRHWDITDRIRGIRGALMAWQGADDTYGTMDQLSGIQRAVPHARVFAAPGLAHYPHYDDPARTARIVAEFLAPYCG
jgi:pimeloyl-ACP methyl ester carboxylesterase